MTTTEDALRRHGAQTPIDADAEQQLTQWIRTHSAAAPRTRRGATALRVGTAAAAVAVLAIAAQSIAGRDPGDRPKRAPAATGAPTDAPTDAATPTRPTATQPPPAASGMSWRWLFTIDSPPPGWAVVQENIFTGHQLVALQGPTAAICVIDVFAAGAYDTKGIGADATPVTVNGTEGAFATSANGFDQVGPAVSWQYAPGAYALSFCNQGSVDAQGDALAVAAALTAQQRPYTVPFSVGYLPAGFIPSMAQSSLANSTDDPYSTLMVSAPPVPGNDQNSYEISLGIGGPNDLLGAQMLTVNTPDGPREAGFRGGFLIVKYDSFQISIASVPMATTPDELIRIAEGVDLIANPADRRTWLDAQQALP